MVLFLRISRKKNQNQNAAHEFRNNFVIQYKPTSLYMKGMKVLVSKDKKEWKRVGTAIKYFKVTLKGGKWSYAMEFIFQF